MVKGVRGLRFVLCFLREQTAGLSPKGDDKNVRLKFGRVENTSVVTYYVIGLIYRYLYV